MKKTALSMFARLLVVAGLMIVFQPTSYAQDTTMGPPPPPPTETAQGQDIVSTLEAQGNFTILLDALERTGLATQLQGEESFTIFAPTDEAFAVLPEGGIEEMSDEELEGILLYHVVPGTVASADAAAAGMAETAQGGTLTVEGGPEGATVNGAAIVEADLEAANGVIHVIDAVLVPPADDMGAPADTTDAEEYK